jgi:hypothetical protein
MIGAPVGCLHPPPGGVKDCHSMDRWEEGFDTWVPPAGEAVDARAGDERDELLRLARELGAARNAAYRAELEPLRQALREAAETVAAQARELAELRLRLEQPRSFAEGVAELTQKARDADPAATAGR